MKQTEQDATEPLCIVAPWGEVRIEPTSFPPASFAIVNFGAIAGSGRNCSAAINSAIGACNESGGGTVIVPPGRWTSGAIRLKSNVALRLEEGAELVFTNDLADYLPPVLTRWGGIECMNYSAPIFASGCENVAVTGGGTVDGAGAWWWQWKKERQKATAARLYAMALEGVAPEQRLMYEEGCTLRPSLIQFVNCTRVLVEGVTVLSGPMWTLHPIYCDSVVVRGLDVRTRGHNNDGVVPDSCSNVLVEKCFFSTGDDCVVIKSGLDNDGRRVGRPSENIVMRDCRTEEGHGGIVMGSELSGGIRNVFAHDCVFSGTQKGVRIKSVEGRGGFVENVWVRDITMERMKFETVEINGYYGASHFASGCTDLTRITDIHLRNLTCRDALSPIQIMGHPCRPIGEVYMENVTFSARDGFWCDHVENIHMKNCAIVPEGGPRRIVHASPDSSVS